MTDTGPPYPPEPGPGSNAIGVGTIGTTLSIGDIRPFDWRKTVISQYANSPIINKIIENFADYVDQTKNLNLFFDMVMNLDTAQGYGLDVWGRIVGVNRVVKVADTPYFGFAEALPGCLSFNDTTYVMDPTLGFAEATGSKSFGEGVFGLHATILPGQGRGGAFYSGASLTQNFRIEDLDYRRLILAKAAANICDGSIPAINRILSGLFPHRGNAWVSEGQTVTGSWFGFAEQSGAQPFNQASFYNGSPALSTMTMTYNFNFALSPVEYAIVAQSGVLPKPSGVAAYVKSL